MARMRRGVGYCESTQCEDYVKGVFLLNHGDTFYCPRCRQLGKIENEVFTWRFQTLFQARKYLSLLRERRLRVFWNSLWAEYRGKKLVGGYYGVGR